MTSSELTFTELLQMAARLDRRQADLTSGREDDLDCNDVKGSRNDFLSSRPTASSPCPKGFRLTKSPRGYGCCAAVGQAQMSKAAPRAGQGSAKVKSLTGAKL